MEQVPMINNALKRKKGVSTIYYTLMKRKGAEVTRNSSSIMNGVSIARDTPLKRKKEERKMEDLPEDCLVEVFRKVGIESLIESLPFVCKSWYEVTLSPKCWQDIIFTKKPIIKQPMPQCSFPSSLAENDNHPTDEKIMEACIQFIIGRSKGGATTVFLESWENLTVDALNCVADGCPSLKNLVIQTLLYNQLPVSRFICNWKFLETLVIQQDCDLTEIVPQISVHCPNFRCLFAFDASIQKYEASDIASLSNIKYLYLAGARTTKEALLIILKGCKKLEFLDVSYCEGFEDGDDEVLELASHIASFTCKGSYINEIYGCECGDPNCTFDRFSHYKRRNGITWGNARMAYLSILDQSNLQN